MATSPTIIRTRIQTSGAISFPRTVGKIEALIAGGDAPISVVTSVLATDPMLAAMVLGQAAAAGHQVRSLNEAIRFTGLGPVLAAGRSARPPATTQRQAIASCWAQANAVSILLPMLAEWRGHKLKTSYPPELLQLAGLLHDLGHILCLVHFNPEYARACIRQQDGDGPFEKLLAEEIGLGPNGLAALAADCWKLPPEIAAVMIHHRDPSTAGDRFDLCALAHIAHILAMASGFTAAGDRYVAPINEQAISLLDLRIADIESLLARFNDHMEELELFEGALGG
jgi:HD-like signal output (HDOD) protein